MSRWSTSGLKPDQYDIESMSLLFYDEVMRGVEARIREQNWSLLITFLREEDMPLATGAAGGAGAIPAAGAVGQGGRPADRRGHPGSPTLAKLARRVPLVVVAGDTAQRAVDVVSADNWSGAHALVEHLVVDHGRRRLFHIDGPATAPDATERRLAMAAVIEANPGTALTGSFTGRFSVMSAAGRAPLAAARGTAGSCPTRSSARTTRWRSARCARWRRAASGCPRTSRWSASTTSSPPACATRR